MLAAVGYMVLDYGFVAGINFCMSCQVIVVLLIACF